MESNDVRSPVALSYLIHCVPPPPPVHSRLLSAGSWTARHQERSDVIGQALTTETHEAHFHSTGVKITHNQIFELFT